MPRKCDDEADDEKLFDTTLGGKAKLRDGRYVFATTPDPHSGFFKGDEVPDEYIKHESVPGDLPPKENQGYLTR